MDERKEIVKNYMKELATVDPVYEMSDEEFEKWYNNPSKLHQSGVQLHYEIALELASNN